MCLCGRVCLPGAFVSLEEYEQQGHRCQAPESAEDTPNNIWRRQDRDFYFIFSMSETKILSISYILLLYYAVSITFPSLKTSALLVSGNPYLRVVLLVLLFQRLRPTMSFCSTRSRLTNILHHHWTSLEHAPRTSRLVSPARVHACRLCSCTTSNHCRSIYMTVVLSSQRDPDEEETNAGVFNWLTFISLARIFPAATQHRSFAQLM